MHQKTKIKKKILLKDYLKEVPLYEISQDHTTMGGRAGEDKKYIHVLQIRDMCFLF